MRSSDAENSAAKNSKWVWCFSSGKKGPQTDAVGEGRRAKCINWELDQLVDGVVGLRQGGQHQKQPDRAHGYNLARLSGFFKDRNPPILSY